MAEKNVVRVTQPKAKRFGSQGFSSRSLLESIANGDFDEVSAFSEQTDKEEGDKNE